MSAERPHQDNSGVLFQNRRRSHPNAPALTGECTVNGTRFRMAAWEKRDRTGTTFWSVAFSVPSAPVAAPVATPAQKGGVA